MAEMLEKHTALKNITLAGFQIIKNTGIITLHSSIHISDNIIGDEGAIFLCEKLKKNTSLEQLDLKSLHKPITLRYESL